MQLTEKEINLRDDLWTLMDEMGSECTGYAWNLEDVKTSAELVKAAEKALRNVEEWKDLLEGITKTIYLQTKPE